MIVVKHIADPDDLTRFCQMMEHTQERYENTFIAHYHIMDEDKPVLYCHQDIFIDKSWAEVKDQLFPLLAIVYAGITLILVNAKIVELSLGTRI